MKTFLVLDWEAWEPYRKVCAETKEEAYKKILKYYCEESPDAMMNALFDQLGVEIRDIDEMENLDVK